MYNLGAGVEGGGGGRGRVLLDIRLYLTPTVHELVLLLSRRNTHTPQDPDDYSKPVLA